MYKELKEIQSILWKNDDLLDQDDLFIIQDKLADVLLKVANKEGKTEDLINSFGFLYNRVED